MNAAMAQLESMGGLNGIALPEQFAGILQGMPRLVSSANISFRKLFANELSAPLTAIFWIAASAAIALFMPNTQQIMCRYAPVLEQVSQATGLLQHAQWQPTWPWLLVVALTSTFTLLHLSRVSEFLYFQF